MTGDKTSVLVLGCDERSGLSVIRSLGRAGIAVDVAWLENGSVARSRYVRRVLDIPRPDREPDTWLQALMLHLRETRYDLVVPCNDRAVVALQKNREALENFSRLYVLSDEAFAVCFGKIETALLAEQCGVSQPKWEVAGERSNTARIVEEFGLPLVLKPASSYDLVRPTSRRSVVIAHSARDAGRALEAMQRQGAVLIQSYFRGVGVGVELLAKDGALLVAFQHERLHEDGGSSYRRSTNITPELLAAATRMVSSLSYTGVMMVEFRVNPQTGDWIFVEINGRFWGSLPLAVAAGADFPLYLFQMLTEDRSTFPQRYTTNLHCRHLLLDLAWLKSRFRERGIRAISPSAVLRTVARALLLRERLDTLTLDDPGPGVHEMGSILALVRRRIWRLSRRVSGYSAITRHYRRKRSTRLLAGARSVLFVCKGNICRSPFAQYLAQRYGRQGVSFSSAGTLHRPDRAPPVEALAAASEWGIELTGSNSRVLSPEIAARSDVVIVFDNENYESVISLLPERASTIVRLADFSLGKSEEISDPFGLGLEEFRICYKTIADALFTAGLVRSIAPSQVFPA